MRPVVLSWRWGRKICVCGSLWVLITAQEQDRHKVARTSRLASLCHVVGCGNVLPEVYAMRLLVRDETIHTTRRVVNNTHNTQSWRQSTEHPKLSLKPINGVKNYIELSGPDSYVLKLKCPPIVLANWLKSLVHLLSRLKSVSLWIYRTVNTSGHAQNMQYAGSIFCSFLLMKSKFSQNKLTWTRVPTNKTDRKPSVLEI